MKIIYLALTVIALAACSGNTPAEASAETESASFDAYKLDKNEWVETDLSKISPTLNATVKVPKDAVLKKNEFDGVDIKMGDYYVITVGSTVDKDLASAMRFHTMDLTPDAYKNIKMHTTEPNGVLYTYTRIGDENVPESHFFYVLEKDSTSFITFKDNHSLMTDVPGSAFPFDNAKTAYEMIKSSAKMNAPE